MIDPFESGKASRLIVPRHNGARVQIPSIPKELLDSAHAVCHVDFWVEDDEPKLTGFVHYRLRHRRIEINQSGAEVYSLAQNAIKRRAKRGHAAFRLIPVRPSAFKKLGRFSCDIYWFNRRIAEAIDGLSQNATQTRREISHWSGGPMLYRHGYRILPYGDPVDDWLFLDEEAFGVKGFKLNRQQMIGRVSLETPHAFLSEQTNREGLIQNDVVDALRKMLMWVVHSEMRGLINDADAIEKIERRAAELETSKVSATRRKVEAALERLRNDVGDNPSIYLEELNTSIASLCDLSEDLVERICEIIQAASDEREKFVYLAGIGLMTEFIFHKLERAVVHTIDSVGKGRIQR